MEFQDVKLSEIEFKEKLSSNRHSVIFLITLRDTTCVMKVHHGRGPKEWPESPARETNIYICESTAYRRMMKSGICDRGITPRFYGTLENIDPSQCQPHLKAFVKDEYPPTAIFLEYIPNMKPLFWTNYTEKRMQNFVDGITAIHQVLIMHDDIHPRNMMILEEDPERAIWIDFDRAQTYDQETGLVDRQREFIDFEKGIVDEMAEFIKEDFIEGKMNKTKQYYH